MQLHYNSELAGRYLEYFRQMEKEFALENDIKVSHLSRCPEVLTMEEQEIDVEELWSELERHFGQPVNSFPHPARWRVKI